MKRTALSGLSPRRRDLVVALHRPGPRGEDAAGRRHRPRIVAAAALVVAAVSLAACTSGQSDQAQSSASDPSTSGTQSSATTPGTTPASAPVTTPATTAVKAAKQVHIKLLEDDSNGPVTYGVGMPIVAYFSSKIAEGRDFSKATTVTINGRPNAGTWFFENSAIIKGYPLEAHYRPAPQSDSANPYWPAHSAISMTMNTNGVSAGPGAAFDDSLTLRMNIGDAHISTVNCAAGVEKMTVTDNGKVVRTMPTSCGAPDAPTFTGTKVVMQKGEQLPGSDKLRPDGTVRMIGSNGHHYDTLVPWSVRVTGSGEYVHAASWNGRNIGARSTSDGCTNLNTPDAKWFYGFAQLGDVVSYTGTGGPKMPYWDGFGDWNVAAATWHSGGIVPTT